VNIIQRANEIAQMTETTFMYRHLGQQEQEFVDACCVALDHVRRGTATAVDTFTLSLMDDLMDDGRT